MDQGRLTCRVCNTAATGGDSGKRRNVDDTAHSVAPKPWRERPRQQEWPTEVRLKDTIPNVRRQRIERSERNTDVPCGVVDEDVDSTEMADYLVDAGIDRFRITLIQLYGEALPAQLSHRVDRCIGATCFSHIGHGNICTRRGKSLHNRSPDVARAPGYEGDFLSEVHSAPRSPAIGLNGLGGWYIAWGCPRQWKPALSACDPIVWSGRASQEVFMELAANGLASMYPA